MIKKLSKCVREYKKPALLTPIFMFGEVACECVVPFIIGLLIDNISKGDLGQLFLYAGILVVLATASLYFGFMGGKIAAKASTGFGTNVRHDLFYKLQGFSFANIDKFSSSSLVTRMTSDVGNVQMAFQMLIRIVVRAPLMMIFAIIMTFTINDKLAWIFVLIVPLLGGILAVIIVNAFKLFNKLFPKYDQLNASVQENVKAIRVVKSFVREEHEKTKFAKASDDLAQNFVKAERLVALNMPAMQFFIYAAYVLVSVLGAYAIVNSANGDLVLGTLTTGNLSSLITYGIQILASLMMLSMIMVMLTLAASSAKRICEVLDEQSTIVNPENPVTVVKDGSIDFNNVSFKYSKDAERNALEDIDLHIRSGMTVGIIGGTGSSKSTLVSLISRLYDVSCGSVCVGGEDVRAYDLDALRNAVSVVLQKNVLFSGTIRDNLRWGDENATDEEIERVCRLAQADEFIRQFPDGYDTVIEQGGTNVSGGQKQRLCIARALLKKPKVLILDDSTSAVDTRTDAAIRAALSSEIPDTTKLIIAQRVSSVEHADMIIVLDGGKLNGIGTSEELLQTNDIYKEIYAIQNKVGGKE